MRALDRPASRVVEFHDWVTQDGQTYGDGVDISAPVTAITDLTYGGVVETTANAPLADATLTLTGPFQGLAGQSAATYTATTDDRGDFQLTGLPGGVYYLNTSAPDGWLVTAPNTITLHNTGDTAFTGIPDGTYDLVLSDGWQLASGAAYQQIDTADIGSDGTIDVPVVPVPANS